MRQTLLREGADAIIKEEEAIEEMGKTSKKKSKSMQDEQREIKAALVYAATITLLTHQPLTRSDFGPLAMKDDER
eukprot:4925882-Amphidinium_carterae.1